MCKEVDAESGSGNGKGKDVQVQTELPEPYHPDKKTEEQDTLRPPTHSTALVDRSTTIAQSKGNPIEDISVSS